MMLGWVTISAFRNDHGILGLVTFSSLVLELRIVVLRSLQVSASDFGSTTYFGDSVSLSMAIAFNFIALVSLLIVSSSIRINCLPCHPTTISSVASLVSKSKMLREDFAGIGLKNGRKFKKDLEKKQRRYGFAWSRALDEDDYLTIDYEPLDDDYNP